MTQEEKIQNFKDELNLLCKKHDITFEQNTCPWYGGPDGIEVYMGQKSIGMLQDHGELTSSD